MMQKIYLIAAALMVALCGFAQTEQPSEPLQPVIGFLSYDSVLVSMPAYAEVMDSVATERQAYEQELKRVEDEFNTKYEAFLENRKDFPRTILLKRQNELQELLQSNIDFKNKSRKELRELEKNLLAPLRSCLNATIAEVAREKGLALVMNTDSEVCPFIDPAFSIDLTEEVLNRLTQ